MSRTCKKCGTIDYDIWGTIGLIGFSLMVASLGYALAFVLMAPRFSIVLLAFGTCLYLPLYFISLHEKRDQKRQEE